MRLTRSGKKGQPNPPSKPKAAASASRSAPASAGRPASANASRPASANTSRPASANARRSASPVAMPINISATAMSMYKRIHAQLEAQKQAAQEAQDAAIRTRNRELLEADDDGSAEDQRAAKKRKAPAESNELSDDEAAMAAGLASIRAAALGRQQEEEVPSDEERRPNAGEDEELHAELDGVNVDDVDVEMELDDIEPGLTNQIEIDNSNEDEFASASQASLSTSSGPKTPRPKKQSISACHTSKVVEKDFTPRTLKLALASKGHVRTRTIYDEPFPRNNKVSRINFAWTTIKESAIASDDVEVRQAFKRAKTNTTVKGQLMKFTLYGRTGLMSSIISKAREKVRSHYCLTGDPDVVRKDVEWLLKDSHFVYGGIELKQRTVDHMKPFGAQLIIDIIESQWFPATSRSKLDLETTNMIYEKRDLPLNIILLVVTAIEHALKEWSTNGRKASQITFSEDTARLSYERHLGHWKFFEAQMKAWPKWWRKTVLDQILANHSHFNIDVNQNDFAALDFSALDRLAGYEGDRQEEGEATEGAVGEEGGNVEPREAGRSEELDV